MTTAELYAEHLAQPTPGFDPREIRLSEVGQCARRQTLRILGYPADPPTPTEQSVFATGHRIEDFVYRLWARRYPRRVRRQVPVRTPYGTGHIDLWVAPERKIVEVKSTTQARIPDLPLAAHVDQLHVYQYFWGARRGATLELAYVIKETGEVQAIAVPYDPARARQLVVTLIAIQGAVTLTQEPLPVPDDYTPFQFPCAWGRGRCPYWRHCWGDAARDADADTVTADPLAPELARYASLRDRRAALRAQADTVDAEITMLEQHFSEVLDAHAATVLRAGPYRLRRTVVPGRVTYDVPAALAPYQKTGRGYARWTVTATRAPAVPT